MYYKKYCRSIIVYFLVGVICVNNVSLSISAFTGGNTDVDEGYGGYIFSDSREVDGPAYQWDEINMKGTLVSESGDDEVLPSDAALPIGFTFPYFDRSFTHFKLNPNGRIFLDADSEYNSNINQFQCLNQDLFTDDNSKIYYYRNETADTLTVEYDHVKDLGNPDMTFTFQTVLHSSGKIDCLYNDISDTSELALIIGGEEMTRLDYTWNLENGLAVTFSKNIHQVNLVTDSDKYARIGSQITVSSTGSTNAEDPILYDWILESKPEGSTVTQMSLTGSSTPQIAFTPDKQGDYVLSFTATNGLPEYAMEVSQKTITIHGYGVSYYTHSDFITPVTSVNPSDTLYILVTDPNLTYTAETLSGTLTTITSNDEEVVVGAKYGESYRFGPISTASGQTGIKNNALLEFQNNESLVLSFFTPKTTKYDFSTASGAQYFGGEKSISIAEIYRPNDLHTYDNLLFASNDSIVFGKRSDSEAGVALFSTSPLTGTATQTLDTSSNDYMSLNTSNFYTPNGVDFYDYTQYNSNHLLHVISVGSGAIQQMQIPEHDTDISQIESIMHFSDTEGVIYEYESSPLKVFSTSNGELTTTKTIDYSTIFGHSRIVLADENQNLLLVSLDLNLGNISVHRLDKTVLTGPENELSITDDNLLATFTGAEMFNTSTLQKYAKIENNTLWLTNPEMEFVKKIDLSTLESKDYTPPAVKDYFIDQENQKLYVTTEVINDEGLSDDIEVCSTAISENTWTCVSYKNSAIYSSYSELPSIENQVYMANKKLLYIQTKDELLSFSLETGMFTRAIDAQNDVSIGSFTGTYTQTSNLYTKIGSDDSEYLITDPYIPNEDCASGCPRWVGWNQQVYQMPFDQILKDDDTIDIVWKGFNTAYDEGGKNDIFLEIYNQVTGVWDLGDSRMDNTETTDFTLQKRFTKTEIAPYIGNGTVIYRVREYEIVPEHGGVSLHTNYVYIAQSTAQSPVSQTTKIFPTAVNGVCGSTNNATVSLAPSSGLCTNGTASGITGTGPWTWSCTGISGGSTSSCSANKTVAPVGVISGGSGGGGGGGSIAIDTCPGGDFSASKYDGTCGTAPVPPTPTPAKTIDAETVPELHSAPSEPIAPVIDSFIYNACKYNDRDFSKISFWDIEHNRRKDDINILLKNCIVNGRTKKEFQPTDVTTRAEFTKAVLRSLGEPYDFVGTTTSFNDMPLLDWKTGVVEKALSLKFIKGVQLKEGLYFEPNRSIQRKEALTILVKGIRSDDIAFLNADHTLEEYVAEAKKYGIKYDLSSSESLPRDEMANIIVTAFKYRYTYKKL